MARWPSGRSGEVHLGIVVSFDAGRGLGTVRAEARPGDGAPPELGFHSTSIADGSRHVEAGRAVAFVIRPGAGGRFEAAQLTVLAEPPAAQDRPDG